jgi:FkbM family methyltransferase
MTHGYMRAWRAYGLAVRVLRTVALPVWRLPVGQGDLGRLLDGIARRFLPATDGETVVEMRWGGRLLLPAGYQGAHHYLGGIYEPAVTELISGLLSAGMTFIDAGAHLGYYTVLAAMAVGPRGRVFAFEPDPAYYRLVQRSLALNGLQNAQVYRLALADTCSMAPFFPDPEEGLGNLFCPVRGDARLSVHTVTLDSFFEGAGWPPVHLVKLDVQGAETAVLRGMKLLLERNPSLALVIEYDPLCQRAAGVGPDRFFATLAELGFRHIYAVEKGMRPVDPDRPGWFVRAARRERFLNLFCRLGGC